YTGDARRFAASADVALFAMSLSGDVDAVNRPARELMSSPAPGHVRELYFEPVSGYAPQGRLVTAPTESQLETMFAQAIAEHPGHVVGFGWDLGIMGWTPDGNGGGRRWLCFPE